MTKKSRQQGGTHVERVRRERGADTAEPPSPPITMSEMMTLLRHEVINVTKGTELRLREITTIATDFAEGKMSAREAGKRYLRHKDRWHDTLSSIASVEGRTDQSILREIDEAHPDFTFPPPYVPQSEKDKGPSR